MTQWFVKELSQITKVSVRALHHYDALGLLTPSIRLENGYRLYSESDLSKLQQIIALKFFGFKLGEIKTLLDKQQNILDNFSLQAAYLEEKAKSLKEASQTLRRIIADCNQDKSIPWKTIIESIEVFQMTQELEKSWAGKVLSPEELKDYVSFERELKTREAEKQQFEKEWAALVDKITLHLDDDPASEVAQSIGKRCMEMVNSLYGRHFAELKRAIWEKGFKQGQIGEDHLLSPKHVDWLDKAIDSYYKKRIYSILAQAKENCSSKILQQWNDLMDEMCGDSSVMREEIYQAALVDENISPAAKAWLTTVWKSSWKQDN
ncbi:MerR family transcriptional regulator [Legionella lansingensis]|uniref:MerR family transcriptional regulator n=1 Tax=Legionella lansingensis TaxID=45067 RepID=A0A0W0VQ71_9GAMM|nr:MerR family transcriptional regulator [Legionella lansingensis]KTD22200.1 MerR family transcriptional regulator [Legionella lansingensis]SNV54943.1 MerR family transcriptional regulator [Legionella lansingensis]